MLIVLDSVIGNVTSAPLSVNSGATPIPGSGGVTVLILLDSDMGKLIVLPFNKIGGETDLPVNEPPETCANNGISICKRRRHLES